MDIRLDGKRALVTGASSGIGKAIAVALADSGAKVGINCRNHLEIAQEVVNQIRKGGGEALALQADISVPGTVAGMFERVDEAWGGIDILINNAGIDGGAGPWLGSRPGRLAEGGRGEPVWRFLLCPAGP